MNRAIISLSLLLLFAVPAGAQRLVADEQTIDCGAVEYGTPVTATFNLKNKGIRRLHVTDVQTSCGCVTASVPRHEIAAGETFEIALTYDAMQLGHFYKSVIVSSDGSKEPVELCMTGVVVQDLKDYTTSYPYSVGDLFTSSLEITFDSVSKGNYVTQTIYIMNAGDETVTPNIMHLPEWLSAVVTPERLSPRHSGRIELTLNSAALHDYGMTRTSVYLAREIGEKISAESALTVRAVLLPDFTDLTATQRANAPALRLTADTLHISSERKNKVTEEILLSNEGKSVLRITSLQIIGSGIGVTLTDKDIQPGAAAKMKVTVTKSKTDKDDARRQVLMITNDPARPEVTVTIDITN